MSDEEKSERRVTVDQETIRKIDRMLVLQEQQSVAITEMKEQFSRFKTDIYRVTDEHGKKLVVLETLQKENEKWKSNHVAEHKEKDKRGSNRFAQTISVISAVIAAAGVIALLVK